MRRLLSLLLVLSVLCCGLHAGGPADAHVGEVAASAANDDPGDVHDGASPAAHGGHHHCPLALDRAPESATHAVELGNVVPIPIPVAALRSRTHAPPIEPPSA